MAAGVHPVDLSHGRQAGHLGEAAQQEHVGAFLFRHQLRRRLDEPVDQVGGLLRPFVQGANRQGRHAGLLRVGFGDVLRKSFPAQPQYEAIVLHGEYVHLHALQLDAVQALAYGSAQLGRNATGASVDEQAV